MVTATQQDKPAIIEILSRSFKDNKSVNYIVRQDAQRLRRIRGLMGYSFQTCMEFGKVWLGEDRHCVALVLFPDREVSSLKRIFRDFLLVFTVVGLGSVFKVLKRESLIKRHYPCSHIFYIWFIGTDPDFQGSGKGTEMMRFLLSEAERMGRSVYLETSTESNIPWYQDLGFEIYAELDFGYKLYLMRKENGEFTHV